MMWMEIGCSWLWVKVCVERLSFQESVVFGGMLLKSEATRRKKLQIVSIHINIVYRNIDVFAETEVLTSEVGIRAG